MGGIRISENDVKEVIQIGDVNGTTVILIGTTGGEDAWAAAVSLAETFDRAGYEEEALLIDAVNAQVRMAKLEMHE